MGGDALSDWSQGEVVVMFVGAALGVMVLACCGAYWGTQYAFYQDQARRFEQRHREEAAARRRQPPRLLGAGDPVATAAAAHQAEPEAPLAATANALRLSRNGPSRQQAQLPSPGGGTLSPRASVRVPVDMLPSACRPHAGRPASEGSGTGDDLGSRSPTASRSMTPRHKKTLGDLLPTRRRQSALPSVPTPRHLVIDSASPLFRIDAECPSGARRDSGSPQRSALNVGSPGPARSLPLSPEPSCSGARQSSASPGSHSHRPGHVLVTVTPASPHTSASGGVAGSLAAQPTVPKLAGLRGMQRPPPLDPTDGAGASDVHIITARTEHTDAADIH
eukprot:TRINITY_DN55586_c0_g1_i1.p1 TRINITY_DN55586_c0_g1~~TRINITY_DN55586_c0_g1_i1.p1  ORF type:complete len:334 (+),score=15.23 TRINITY_DN55586_c0_g1_i1:90-1091(+)